VDGYPEVVRKEVLTRLDPTDLAMLLRVSRGCRAVVVTPDRCRSPRLRYVCMSLRTLPRDCIRRHQAFTLPFVRILSLVH